MHQQAVWGLTPYGLGSRVRSPRQSVLDPPNLKASYFMLFAHSTNFICYRTPNNASLLKVYLTGMINEKDCEFIWNLTLVAKKLYYYQQLNSIHYIHSISCAGQRLGEFLIPISFSRHKFPMTYYNRRGYISV